MRATTRTAASERSASPPQGRAPRGATKPQLGIPTKGKGLQGKRPPPGEEARKPPNASEGRHDKTHLRFFSALIGA